MNRRKQKRKAPSFSATEYFSLIWDSQSVSSMRKIWQLLPNLHRRLLAVLIPVVLVLLLLPAPQRHDEEIKALEKVPQRVSLALNIDGADQTLTQSTIEKQPATQSIETQVGQSPSVTLSTPPQSKPQANSVPVQVNTEAGPKPWNNYQVKSGDTLSQVFRNNNLPLSDLSNLLKVEGDGNPLSQLHVGQMIRFKVTNSGQLDILQLEKSDGNIMYFRLSSGGFARSK